MNPPATQSVGTPKKGGHIFEARPHDETVI